MTVLFFIVIVCSVIVAIPLCRNKKYKGTAYYQVTGNSYSSVTYDKGKHGEYLIYERLRKFEDIGGKFLFNIYVPKSNGDTTEIDLLLICSRGLFVIESKNYGGWIFGNESNRNWTQIFPKGRGRSHKERFYNPIRQNASHVRHLRNLVGRGTPMQSIIVFSDECTFKDVTVNSDVRVVYRRHVLSAVHQSYEKQTDVLTQEEVNALYDRLYPYTQVCFDTAKQHVSRLGKH